MSNPKRILLISGKRKSGKDYISERLKLVLKDSKCSIVRISEPIKSYYASKNNLNLNELMSDGTYKEQHRLPMIQWSEKMRAENPGFFCEAACKNTPAKPIWIVSDIRRKTDIKWFKDNYGNVIKTIRISADNEVRKNRGWNFTKGIDDVSSECDLDDFTLWDLIITNNDKDSVVEGLKRIFTII